MNPSKRRPSPAKIAVILVIVAAVVFAAYVGYLAYTNQSFPSEQRPFSQYAALVAPPQFNGTELSFQVRWLNSDFIPVKAQISSDSTDAANSPACYTDLQTVSSGQIIAMPFGLGSLTATVNNVQLAIDVMTVGGSHEFTIVYTLNSTAAANGDVTPTNIACEENSNVM